MAGKPKPKFYVVWRGHEPGVYATWEQCETQVKGYGGAAYKSFPTFAEAQAAFNAGPPVATSQRKRPKGKGNVFPENPPEDRHDTVIPLPKAVTANAWAVDAACSGNPGQMEYRGVDLATGAEVFHFGPTLGTNNIGEFLAIVHALAAFHKQGIVKTIYSDSRIAMGWVRKGHCKTTLPHNTKTARLHEIISRAEAWLSKHPLAAPILKWKTEQWGEIPADFGRKH